MKLVVFLSVIDGVATVAGLHNVKAGELVRFSDDLYGIALKFKPEYC